MVLNSSYWPLYYHTVLIYENEEGDVSSYWIKFWKRHYDGNVNKKQQIDLFGELALEWTMDRTDVKHLGEKQREDEDGEEDVSSYWINFERRIILEN